MRHTFSSHVHKWPNYLKLFLLISISIAIPFLLVEVLTLGILLVATIIALPIAIFLLTNIRFGFYVILTCSFLIAFVHRISGGSIPYLVLEVMMLLVFTGFLIGQIRTHSMGINAKYARHPITVALILWTAYTILQLFNPNSSSMLGKLIAIRFSCYNLMGFIIALKVFEDLKSIKTFFKIVLGLSLLAAVYGLSQKYIGLLPYDHEWLFSSPQRMSLIVIWGNVRSWGYLNDPANFGLLMAFSGILCFVLMLGPYSLKRKIILGVSGMAMFLAMVASGTRTAFVMVPVGFGIFGLLTINNFKTILFSVVTLFVCLGIYFGPFYSEPVRRIRTAFQGNDDPSMNVRSENKSRIQPYIWTHPIGGGPSTTGEEGRELAPGHQLAGFPPDSGYLKLALEFGYIGLLIVMWQYFIASSKGIHQYFNASDKEIKSFYVAILASFIALCSANLTQLSSAMRPFDFITFAFYAMLIRLQEFDTTR